MTDVELKALAERVAKSEIGPPYANPTHCDLVTGVEQDLARAVLRLLEERAVLRAALEEYADKGNWLECARWAGELVFDYAGNPAHEDHGWQIARAALTPQQEPCPACDAGVCSVHRKRGEDGL